MFCHARFALRDASEKNSPFLDKEEVRVNITKQWDSSSGGVAAPSYVNILLGGLCFLLDPVTPTLRAGGVGTGSSSLSGAGKREQNSQGQTQFSPGLQPLKGLVRRPQPHFQV